MIGESIAHYRITGKLGEGGMGAVYRAIDTKLNREVAVKVLPEGFAEDSARMARFEREAQMLAALNHPNLAAIYGIEQNALVMELVEGEDLKGPLPIGTAIEYARQIAAGVEAAHEKGIVHRDLKPANIRITPEGVVKILDFGLAKATETSAASVANSPTLTIGGTLVGTVLGTAGYMSPEQARGKTVDKRADIWAFGVVLYEMLTGAPLFAAGDNVTDVLAAVVMREPDWSALPPDTPPNIRRLLERCLRKDPKQRLRDIGDARIALEDGDITDPVVAVPTPSSRSRIGWAAAAVATLAAGAGWWRAAQKEAHPVLNLSIVAPEKAAFDAARIPALSPDGRRLAFIAITDGRKSLWVRDLDSMAAKVIPGSEDSDHPFWSPDGRFVAFFAQGKLKKVDVSGGSPVVVCDAIYGAGGSWNRNDVIVFAPSPATELFKVPASGGNADPVTSIDRAAGETAHRSPFFLPDGPHFLFTIRTMEAQRDGIYVGDLESKNKVRLFAAQSNAVYTPPGLILFARDGTLLAQPTDSAGLRITGTPVPVVEHVTSDSVGFSGKFTASQTGMLAFYSGGSLVGASYLTWYDRSGKVLGTVGPPSMRLSPAISPRGDFVAEDRINSANRMDLWLHSMDGKTDSRLSFDQLSNFPVWSPDGSRILFQSYRPDGSAGICQKSSTGTGKDECFFQMPGITIPTSWSHNGLAVFFNQSKQTGYDLWVLPLTGDRKPYPFLQTPANESNGRLAPDDRWLAYQSDEAGTSEIYVMAFPGKEGKWQISTRGGSRPLWSRDGKELFYIAADQKMMAVSVKTSAGFEHGAPVPLFETRTWSLPGYDVTADGKRFLMVSPVGQDSSASMNVMVNWQAGLRK